MVLLGGRLNLDIQSMQRSQQNVQFVDQYETSHETAACGMMREPEPEQVPQTVDACVLGQRSRRPPAKIRLPAQSPPPIQCRSRAAPRGGNRLARPAKSSQCEAISCFGGKRICSWNQICEARLVRSFGVLA